MLTVGITQPVAPRQPQEQAQAKNRQCLTPVGYWAQHTEELGQLPSLSSSPSPQLVPQPPQLDL